MFNAFIAAIIGSEKNSEATRSTMVKLGDLLSHRHSMPRALAAVLWD
jgi:hypothetical protein